MSDPTENTPPSQPSRDSTPSATPSPGTPIPAAPAYQAQPAPVYGAPAAPGQPGYGQPAAYGQQPGPATFNVLSIIAFVSAFVVFPAAIICGHIAMSQIKKTGEKGRGFAIAALVLGYLGLVITILSIIVFFVVLGMMAANPAFDPYGQF